MSDRQDIRELMRKVRAVLNNVWSPLSGCPDDEYDAYVAKITGMVHSRATDAEILRYLEWAEVTNLGLGTPFDSERGERIVSALRALMPRS